MNILAADSPLISAITTTAADITSQFGAVLPIALPVAGGILAATVGWKVFRRFVKA